MAPVSDGAFAAWLASKVGDLLLELRETMGFDDPDALRHAGDKKAHSDAVTSRTARRQCAELAN
jgi:3'(2'), 5'-bisphosphate nucleotidase